MEWFSLKGEHHDVYSSLEYGQSIKNLVRTKEGYLRNIVGPRPLLYDGDDDGVDAFELPSTVGSLSPTSPFVYGTFHGIYTDSDYTLIHVDDQLWYKHNRRWIVAATGLRDATGVHARTQFVRAGNNVVIATGDGNVYHFDGEQFAVLGFPTPPAAPTSHGPHSTQYRLSTGAATNNGTNDAGYSHCSAYETDSGTEIAFRFCRIGTTQGVTEWTGSFATSTTPGVVDSTAPVTGWLEAGSWRYAVQFLDRWGNLSALSAPSNEVKLDRQLAAMTNGTNNLVMQVDYMRYQFAVEFPLGPVYTAARVGYRTKDMHQGDAAFYELPRDAAGTYESIGTMPDNLSTIYPDNIPDTWLGRPPRDVISRPPFDVIGVAFGRLFGAADGRIFWSNPSLYGTFELQNQRFIGKVTAMLAVPNGLLVFTSGSTLMVTETDQGFTFNTISQRIGCTARHSPVLFSDGLPIWMHNKRFYTIGERGVQEISGGLHRWVTRISNEDHVVATYDEEYREYRCWVPVDGQEYASVCLVFDGTGWRHRTDLTSVEACSGKLAAGRRDGLRSVFVLDRDSTLLTNTHTCEIETSWIFNSDGNRLSPKRLYLKLTDVGAGDYTISIYRDHEETAVYTTTISKSPPVRPAPRWGDAVYGTDIPNKRIFTVAKSIDLPSCDCFKIKVSGTDTMEFIAMGLEVKEEGTNGSRSV